MFLQLFAAQPLSRAAAVLHIAALMHGSAVRDPSQPALYRQRKRRTVEGAKHLDSHALVGVERDHDNCRLRLMPPLQDTSVAPDGITLSVT